MKNFFLLPLLALALPAAAQTPITLTQATFPASATTVERYQNADAALSNLTATITGANRNWDYRSLMPSGSLYSVSNAPVPSPAGIAGAQWTRSQQGRIGPFYYDYASYQALTSAGRMVLGRGIARQALSLASTTGGANDSVVINRQVVPFGTGSGIVDVPLPFTAGGRLSRSFRIGTTGSITVRAFGLNNAPFRIVQRYQYVDSVAGWGTLRIPAAGYPTGTSTGTIPVLQVRSRTIRQDSIFLNGSPAPALLLQVLGLTQGGYSTFYVDQFWRNGSSQPMLDLYYATSQYGTPNAADYSAEASLLGTQSTALPATALRVWPNPVSQGQSIQFELATTAAQFVHVVVRDSQGHSVAQGTAHAGQPVELLRGLSAGLYLLEVESANSRATQRVVVE